MLSSCRHLISLSLMNCEGPFTDAAMASLQRTAAGGTSCGSAGASSSSSSDVGATGSKGPPLSELRLVNGAGLMTDQGLLALAGGSGASLHRLQLVGMPLLTAASAKGLAGRHAATLRSVRLERCGDCVAGCVWVPCLAARCQLLRRLGLLHCGTYAPETLVGRAGSNQLLSRLELCRCDAQPAQAASSAQPASQLGGAILREVHWRQCPAVQPMLHIPCCGGTAGGSRGRQDPGGGSTRILGSVAGGAPRWTVQRL